MAVRHVPVAKHVDCVCVCVCVCTPLQCFLALSCSSSTEATNAWSSTSTQRTPVWRCFMQCCLWYWPGCRHAVELFRRSRRETRSTGPPPAVRVGATFGDDCRPLLLICAVWCKAARWWGRVCIYRMSVNEVTYSQKPRLKRLRFMRQLVYSIRCSVVSINSSPLTVTLCCLVTTALIYNDTEYSVTFMVL